MKIKILLFTTFLFTSLGLINAQSDKQLSLVEVAKIAIENSDDIKISANKIVTAEEKLNVIKNNQYPDFNISGQYMYLPQANIKGNLLSMNGESNGPPPPIHHLLLGQVSAGMPVFSGFKLKNSIKAGENRFKAAIAAEKNVQEEIGLQAIRLYVALYKAHKTVELVQENLKSAVQRVTDFTEMEKNGLLAKNDLLKAELQKSNIGLTLEEARKNERLINYQLISFLKLPEETEIDIDPDSFSVPPVALRTIPPTRNDLKAMEFQSKAAKNQIEIAKGNYYPSVSLSAGFIDLGLGDAISVTNAINIGLGVSYNLSSIFKNKSNIAVAKSQALEVQYSLEKLKDNIRFEIKEAEEEYQLALKNEEVYKKSRVQAKENYRIVKDKYDNGLQDTNDLLEADLQQLQTEINLAYAKADIAEKYFDLQKTNGKLVQVLNN